MLELPRLVSKARVHGIVPEGPVRIIGRRTATLPSRRSSRSRAPGDPVVGSCFDFMINIWNYWPTIGVGRLTPADSAFASRWKPNGCGVPTCLIPSSRSRCRMSSHVRANSRPSTMRCCCPADLPPSEFYARYGFLLVAVERKSARPLSVWELRLHGSRKSEESCHDRFATANRQPATGYPATRVPSASITVAI
jgi:hypothetical protein